MLIFENAGPLAVGKAVSREGRIEYTRPVPAVYSRVRRDADDAILASARGYSPGSYSSVCCKRTSISVSGLEKQIAVVEAGFDADLLIVDGARHPQITRFITGYHQWAKRFGPFEVWEVR